MNNLKADGYGSILYIYHHCDNETLDDFVTDDDAAIVHSDPRLASIPLEIRQKSFEDIFNFLRDLKRGSLETYRNKVMFIGHQSVGKTSLYQTLQPLSASFTTPTGGYQCCSATRTHYIVSLVGPILVFKSGHTSYHVRLDTGMYSIYRHDATHLILEANRDLDLQLARSMHVEFLEAREQIADDSVFDLAAKSTLIYPQKITFAFHGTKSNATMLNDDDVFCRRFKDFICHWVSNAATTGISTEHVRVPAIVGGQSVQLDLRFMDFAGQEEYNSAHQFFINHRSVFLVLWNMSRPNPPDGLYRSLRNVLRGVMSTIPGPLLTVKSFHAWKHAHLGIEPAAVFPPERLVDIENLINAELAESESSVKVKIVLNTEHNEHIASEICLSCPNQRVTKLCLSFDGKMYSDQVDMHGIKLWFQNLISNLGPYPQQGKSMAEIFVVGTHSDMAWIDGNGFLSVEPKDVQVENFKHRVAVIDKLAKDAGLDFPLRFHEISCHTMHGLKELRRDMLSVIGSMPHMGEKIPKSYSRIQTILNKRYKTSTSNCRIGLIIGIPSACH